MCLRFLLYKIIHSYYRISRCINNKVKFADIVKKKKTSYLRVAQTVVIAVRYGKRVYCKIRLLQSHDRAMININGR